MDGRPNRKNKASFENHVKFSFVVLTEPKLNRQHFGNRRNLKTLVENVLKTDAVKHFCPGVFNLSFFCLISVLLSVFFIPCYSHLILRPSGDIWKSAVTVMVTATKELVHLCQTSNKSTFALKNKDPVTRTLIAF